jgi:hypothetical protein
MKVCHHNLFLLLALLFLVSCNEQPKTVKNQEEKAELNKLPPAQVSQPQSEPFNIGEEFIPCGWMECGEYGERYIRLNTNWTENAYSGGSCTKISFTPSCPKKMGGIYWMNIDMGGICNWGDYPGENFSNKGFTKLTFWVRGENGGERIKIVTGGVNSPGKKYKDSFKVSKFITLSDHWEKDSLSITNKDLSSVIGGFCWFANMSDNPRGLSFYLDDIQFE